MAASHAKRKGNALVTAAETIFVHLAQSKHTDRPEFAQAQEALILRFAEVAVMSVNSLLDTSGDYLSDPQITPALQKMWTEHTDPVFAAERVAISTHLAKLASTVSSEK